MLLTGIQRQLPLVFQRGSNIQFVHIPDNVDVMQLVEDRVRDGVNFKAAVFISAIFVQCVVRMVFFWISESGDEHLVR